MFAPTMLGRELKWAARRPATYNLRLLSAGVLLAICASALLDVAGAGGPEWGVEVFSRLHATLIGAIWVLVPAVTADCISRERRERTLPLLLLTALTPRQILRAKGLAEGLRALTLWLATLPILAITIVAGGVGWMDVAFSALVTLSSIFLALAAGILGSAFCRVWTRAMALSLVLGLMLFVALGVMSGLILFPYCFTNLWAGLWWALWGEVMLHDAPQYGLTGLPTPGTMMFLTAVECAASFSLLLVAIAVASDHVRRVWRENPPPERVTRLQRKLTTPVYFNGLFRRWMRWEMERNPVGWLERRSWSSRLVTWMWLAVFICIYSSLLANFPVYRGAFDSIQALMGGLLILAVGVSSAGSFHRERETGLLELLLVSPLTEGQILWGRLRGVWMQFLPAMVLLLGCWCYLGLAFFIQRDPLPRVLIFGTTLLLLPVFGLYYSLAAKTFVGALLASLGMALVLPDALANGDKLINSFCQLTGGYNPMLDFGESRIFLFHAIQATLAGLCGWRLYHNVRGRRFALRA